MTAQGREEILHSIFSVGVKNLRLKYPGKAGLGCVSGSHGFSFSLRFLALLQDVTQEQKSIVYQCEIALLFSC